MFTSIAPLAEKYYGISPYAYCAGDPVNLVDPTGMYTYIVNVFSGEITRMGTKDDPNVLKGLDMNGVLQSVSLSDNQALMLEQINISQMNAGTKSGTTNEAVSI